MSSDHDIKLHRTVLDFSFSLFFLGGFLESSDGGPVEGLPPDDTLSAFDEVVLKFLMPPNRIKFDLFPKPLRSNKEHTVRYSLRICFKAYK